MYRVYVFVFFFNDPATTEIYTLSLHDALPIWTGLPVGILTETDAARLLNTEASLRQRVVGQDHALKALGRALRRSAARDRKSTRLNSSHANISYAVFCLKKK